MSERLRSEAGRRTLGIGLALLIEVLLLLLLLSLGRTEEARRKERSIKVVNVTPTEAPAEEPEPNASEPEQRAEEPSQQEPQPQPQPVEERLPPEPPMANPVPPPPIIIPRPTPPLPSAAAPPRVDQPAPAPKRVYGPPDKGGSASRDTERVGTAPNGEPLYAAAWYREPEDAAMRAYLSTARGPGWGLIACRTAPNYRVEDCVPLEEYPEGAQINRAVLAAAWEFKVRPPRLGGRTLVGSWVRIRIDYDYKRR